MTAAMRRAAFLAREAVTTRVLAARVRRQLRVPGPSSFASFGHGAVVVPPARVVGAEHIEIGSGVVVLEGSWLEARQHEGQPPPRLVIGSGSRIGRSAHISCDHEVVIEDDVLTSDHVFITDSHPDMAGGPEPPRPVRIRRGAFLGIRAAILPGVTVGENAYVGAGAVVTHDVPPRTLVLGNPARPVRAYDETTGAWRAVPGSGEGGA